MEARDIREAKEEEERKLIDIEEAQFQATKRKEAIERAKTQQYYQTDRVKGFHVSVILDDVGGSASLSNSKSIRHYNSLVPGWWSCIHELVIFKLISRITLLCEIALK